MVKGGKRKTRKACEKRKIQRNHREILQTEEKNNILKQGEM